MFFLVFSSHWVLKMNNYIYLRVSKKDLKSGEIQQDLEAQLPEIVNKFKINVNDCIVIKDKGTAYNQEKFKNRDGFIKVLKIIVTSNSIIDIFTGNIKKANINLYIFDYNRFFRNILFGLLFGLVCEVFNCKVYSCCQEDLNAVDDESIGDRISRYIRLAMYQFLAEGYSKNVSDNTKKVVRREDGKTTKSKFGKKWGRWFMFKDGIKRPLEPKEADRLYNYIKHQINNYEKRKIKYYYPLIIEKVIKEFSVKISNSYISKIKKELKY